jgi:hypothetical protein
LSFQRKLELLISKIVVIPAEAGTLPERFILPGTLFHRDWQTCKKDHMPFEINLGGSCSFLLNEFFMISFKYVAKTTAEHRKKGPKKHRPCFLKQ